MSAITPHHRSVPPLRQNQSCSIDEHQRATSLTLRLLGRYRAAQA